jgi:hypothetical protein
VTQSMRAYAFPGTRVVGIGSRRRPSLARSAITAISGYLVDCGPPTSLVGVPVAVEVQPRARSWVVVPRLFPCDELHALKGYDAWAGHIWAIASGRRTGSDKGRQNSF